MEQWRSIELLIGQPLLSPIVNIHVIFLSLASILTILIDLSKKKIVEQRKNGEMQFETLSAFEARIPCHSSWGDMILFPSAMFRCHSLLAMNIYLGCNCGHWLLCLLLQIKCVVSQSHNAIFRYFLLCCDVLCCKIRFNKIYYSSFRGMAPNFICLSYISVLVLLANQSRSECLFITDKECLKLIN